MNKNAGKAEILRSHQKDNFYQNYLRSLIADITHSLIGPRLWIAWRKELDIAADLGYFILTTVSGFQTIGEEYVSIVQIDTSRRNIPSTLRRALMCILHILMPYLIRKSLDWLEKRLQAREEELMPAETRDFLLRCIPVARTAVLYAHRLHMATFYIQGIYYHIAKQITNIRYIQYNVKPGALEDNTVSHNFRVLGWLTLTQLIGTGVLAGYKSLKGLSLASKHTDNTNISVSETVCAERKCCLCLEERQHSSVTPCGHLFCWHCIQEWCSTKNECPLCREKIEQHRIVCLQNFDPV